MQNLQSNAPDAMSSSIDRGFGIFKSAWGTLVVTSLVVIGSYLPGQLVSQGAQIIQAVMQRSGAGWGAIIVLWSVVFVVVMALSALITWPIQAGAFIVAVRASRSGQARLGDVLAAYRRLAPVIVASVVAGLIGFIAALPGAVLIGVALWPVIRTGSFSFTAWSIVAASVGFIWLLIVGVIVGVVTMLAPIRAADPDLPPIGGIEAIVRSFEGSRSRLLEGIGIAMLSGLAVAIGALCCCIGLPLFGMPLWFGLVAGYYREVFAASEPAPPPPPMPWSGSTPPTQPF
jgi:hypothetical protein